MRLKSIALVILLFCGLITGGCDSSSSPPITAGFTWQAAGLSVQFFNTSQNAHAWQWDFGDLSSRATERDPLHTYAMPGQYPVRLTACPNTDYQSDKCGITNGIVTVSLVGNTSGSAVHIITDDGDLQSFLESPFSSP